MNSVLVLVMLILVIFALKEGMIWVALGVGVLMVILATSDEASKSRGKFIYKPPELPPIQPPKEQMLRVKYQPRWDGNNWWEEIADHWGSSLGRIIGLVR